ncbi:MAG: PstS family phosphate ABC transporter substrate-binding protein [Clostridia bacterium]
MKKTHVKKIIALVIALTFLFAFTGCNRSVDQPTTSPGTTPTPASELTGSYQIRGSDTEVNMVQRLTEVYSAIHPKVQFAVTGGGSGTGIAALINKQIDIANSSRAMSDSEIQQAKNNGVNPVPFVFSQDGLAIIVHKDNPLTSLTFAQIGGIYSGAIKNWKEVGGNDMAISAYGRQSTSGTFSYFRDTVVKADYSNDKKMMSGNAAIVEGVMADIAGIGYVGIGYAAEGGNAKQGLKVLMVAEDASKTPTTPLEMANITSGLYPLVRPLYHYTDGTPSGALKNYLEFVFSDDGQKVVVESGFFPITDEYNKQNSENLK